MVSTLDLLPIATVLKIDRKATDLTGEAAAQSRMESGFTAISGGAIRPIGHFVRENLPRLHNGLF